MKLILASNGFYTAEIIEKAIELTGKPAENIDIAVINEAYAVEHGDHGWVLDDLTRIKAAFSGRMELVNLLALDISTVKKRIQLADIIFVVGGHTDYLMSVFVKTGFAALLPELLATKVYVGSSAGSMVLGKRVSTEAYAKIYGENNDYGIDHYLELVNFALKPHMDSPIFTNNRKEILLEVAKDFHGTLYGLRDDSAIIVNGNEQYVIGSNPIKITDGKLDEIS